MNNGQKMMRVGISHMDLVYKIFNLIVSKDGSIFFHSYLS
jgi:hypothetical protein